MKTISSWCLIALILACTFSVQAEEAADWVTLNTPGKAHRKLDGLVGKWKTTTRIWMAGPEQPPTVSQGEATFEWILDGRFLEERTESFLNFPDGNGGTQKVPYSGRGLTGFDNVKKLYVSTWVDSLGTQINFSKGQFSGDGKVMTMYGEMDEPAQGVYGGATKMQTVFETGDRHIFTMYDLHTGEDYRMMEIVYERI